MMRPDRRTGRRLLIVLALAFVMLVFVFQFQTPIGRAATTAGGATIFSPTRIGGASGNGDERDADTYPAVAFDLVTNRYLVVWMSPRKAGSSSDGFDVYGVFVGITGQVIGSEFRISDSNTVARNALPTVAAGNGEFAVGWTTRGTYCQIYVQHVTDTSPRTDRVLVSGTGHRHSPHLTYNSARQRYALVFVEGDDYLPPTFFGAQTADCGNNASSTSRIDAAEFFFSGEIPIITSPVVVSDVSSGGFRPRLAYGTGLNQYLVGWEDRRNAGGQPYRFDVYAQRLGSDLTKTGNNLALSTGFDYTNDDTSATWTPRPAIVGADSQFLATWFTRDAQGSGVTWSVLASLLSASGAPGTPFTVAQMSFASTHIGNAPTGFLVVVYLNTTQEYMIGMTNHLESLRGYLSSARVQRVNTSGQLLKMDGAILALPGVGYAIDYENEDQISIGMATNNLGGACGIPNYFALYSKHTRTASAQDLDIWGAGIQVKTNGLTVQCLFLPLIRR